MSANPNPQGKGALVLLEDLSRGNAPVQNFVAKDFHRIQSELFTSLFILDATFNFKPVTGRDYWLYQVDTGFNLSLIAPDDWMTGQPGPTIGKCRLREDLTWTLDLDAEAAQDPVLTAWIEKRWKEIEERLFNASNLHEAMPFHEAHLSYQQRVLAYALGKSLDASMTMGGVNQLTAKEALGLIGGGQSD